MPKQSLAELPIDLHISRVIKKRRKQLNLTQKYVAEHIGISIQQLQKYENGHNKISTSKLIEFSKILKFNIADIFIGYDSNNNIFLKEETLIAKKKNEVTFQQEAMHLFLRITCHKKQKKIINMLTLFLQDENNKLL